MFIFGILAQLVCAAEIDPDNTITCRKAFDYKSIEFPVVNTIKICNNSAQIPSGYLAELNMAVCDDKLCANVIVKIFWDLAGNYVQFDTIAGKPLTKFDHKRFIADDYKKLDQILKDKNSILRDLPKENLIDRTIKIRSATVDAVTGATPTTIKNSVVEGAVYSSYGLWHFVNGPVKDSIRAYTLRIYSDEIVRQLLGSSNYETQLFALKKFQPEDYCSHFDQIIEVVRKSVPLVKAYIIAKMPLPLHNQEQNKAFVRLFPNLDTYSKSIFIDRITADSQLSNCFLPLMKPLIKNLDQRQMGKCSLAAEKFGIR
jgi:hypothetical protein